MDSNTHKDKLLPSESPGSPHWSSVYPPTTAATPRPRSPTFSALCSPRPIIIFLIAAVVSLSAALTWALYSSSSSSSGGSSTPTLTYGHPETMSPTSTLVESIPLTDYGSSFDKLPSSDYTHVALINALDASKTSVDITVMYWNLLPSEDSSCAGAKPGVSLSLNYCLNNLGGQAGVDLYSAMQSAMSRGVRFRFLQDHSNTDPYPPQLLALQSEYPDVVEIHYWSALDWYSGGIMHQKIWIFDETSFYIGSSNMDWLSLTQVKEVGIFISNSTSMGSDVTDYFDSWWEWSSVPSTEATTEYSVHFFSDEWQTELIAPCWSMHIEKSERCPFPPIMVPTVGPPLPNTDKVQLTTPIDGTPANTFISGSPREVLGDTFSTKKKDMRTWDLDGILYTINNATDYIYLSVMDYIPQSTYSTDTVEGSNIWWPTLNDALLTVLYSRNVTIRVVVSHWAHSDSRIASHLNLLVGQSMYCRPSSDYYAPTAGCGKLEVKVFEVPGWNETLDTYPKPSNATFPKYSRVAHGKYVVTESRTNIGTSNMAWSYFYQTAGASFNTDNEGIVGNMKDVFDRDWFSNYAVPLDEYLSGVS